LLPVFLFALSESIQPIVWKSCLVFIVLHFFVYPASNGFNSYFDKDAKSIGGLKFPPKVTMQLYTFSLLLDFAGLLLAIIVSWQFTIGVFLYGLASKAYSHPSIRLKRHPVIGWLTIGLFQGAITFLISYIGINGLTFYEIWKPTILIPASLSTLLLLGSYPMTQIYQHEEDSKRGDITLSYKLGILGTFLFTAAFFGIASIGFIYFYELNRSNILAIIFFISMIPTVTFFSFWFLKVYKDRNKANFEYTMKLNIISSSCLNVFFLISFFGSM